MKSFRQIFESHEGNLINKWDHYFDIYDRYFSSYRGKPVKMLEIGISHGGSLQIWREYFGDQLELFAVDVNEDCRKLSQPDTTIFIGSQSDPEFLKDIAAKMPELDIILDDGGHTMEQQIVSFEHLFPKVRQGGIYLVEDTHTSYWHEFHGGLKNKGTFIEYAKDLADALYEYHIHDDRPLKGNDITRNISAVAFHDSVVAFEKKLRPKPFTLQRGKETIKPYIDPTLKKLTLFRRIRKKFYRWMYPSGS